MSDDINQEILTEMRKWRRSNQWLLACIGIVVIILDVVNHSKTSSQEHSWTSVDAAFRQGDFPRSLALTQAIVDRQPDYYYGHVYLGSIYLAMDYLTNSEAEYQRAYELFPNEENEKNLAATP